MAVQLVRQNAHEIRFADRLAPKVRVPGPEEQFIERYQQIVGRRAWVFRIGVGLLWGHVLAAASSSLAAATSASGSATLRAMVWRPRDMTSKAPRTSR